MVTRIIDNATASAGVHWTLLPSS